MGFSGRLNTALIERMNLTIRHGIAALARRTWATAQQTPQLLAHLKWWRMYYHFVRPHQSLRVALVCLGSLPLRLYWQWHSPGGTRAGAGVAHFSQAHGAVFDRS